MEIMIGLAIGIVLLASTTAFVASTLHANQKTIKHTRVQQELRAISEVMVNELRRSRGITDPIANIGQGAGVVKGRDVTVEEGCVVFGYQSNLTSQFGAFVHKDNQILMAQSNTALTCDDADTRLNSGEVLITDFEVTLDASNNRLDLSLTGAANNDDSVQPKTLQRTVFIRSGTF